MHIFAHFEPLSFHILTISYYMSHKSSYDKLKYDTQQKHMQTLLCLKVQ